MRYACVSLLAILTICSWSWAENKGLVAQYSFVMGAATQAPQIRIEVLPEPGWIAVEADCGPMWSLPEGSSVEVRILKSQEGKTLARKVERISPHTRVLNVVLNAAP